MACNWLQNSRQKSFRVYCNQVNDGFAQLAVICAKRSIGNFGLVAAVSRIAAILLNGLDLTNMNGPLLPFVTTSKCCGAARQSGHSLQLQNLQGANSQTADKPAFCWRSECKRSILSRLQQSFCCDAAYVVETDIQQYRFQCINPAIRHACANVCS